MYYSVCVRSLLRAAPGSRGPFHREFAIQRRGRYVYCAPSGRPARVPVRPRDEVKKKRPPLRKVLPEIWTLIKPRRWLLAFGFVLMVINRVSGLVLPASTKFLVDDVLVKRQAEKLPWIVGAVLLATTIQAITSFSLTQLLSKAAQRLIADLRMQVQQHIGRLSVSFYDATRTGVLVSRIMTDVEGVRNLIGTGLVDFVGGLLDRRSRLLHPHAHQRQHHPHLLCLRADLRLDSA